MKGHKNSKNRIPTVWRLLNGSRLIELVYLPESKETKLAVHDGEITRLVDELELETGEQLVPIAASNNLIRHEAIVLPGAPEPYGNIATLVSDIERYIDRYVVLSTWFRRLTAYYVLFTWVYDAFEELPYLRIQAELGSGKTRALIVIGSLCHRAFMASGASTVSPIFHSLDTFRGTLILDEADFRYSDQTAELTKILNNGTVRGFPVLRTAITQRREFDPRAFQVFGPKIVAMRKSFDDEALESRFITERLDGMRLRSDIPLNLPKEQREEARVLRNKLLQYRFENRFKVGVDEALADPALSPRANQILVPLLSIIPDEAARSEIRRALSSAEEARIMSRSTSTEGELLEIVAELWDADPMKTVAVAEITARFIERYGKDYDRPLTNRYVGSLIRTRLGLATYKSHGVYILAVDPDRLQALCARYGITRGEKVTP